MAQYAQMFDLWASEHSVLREKVIEHIFLADLSRTLLLDLETPFEVLRAEFDANGYDVVIEAAGLLRHVQLKATAATGRRAHVDINLSLAEKPGGCVVWIFVDPQTLSLGPFLWFGGAAGQRLPSLGEREVRHTRGDATGAKKVRSGLRRVPKGEFTRFATIGELATAMFRPMDHSLVLERHIAQRIDQSQLADLCRNIDWDSSTPVAYLIDGFELAKAAGIDDPFVFANNMRAEAEDRGDWAGTTLELWLALFFEHRRHRQQSQGFIGLDQAISRLPLLDELCFALARSLEETRN